MSAVPFSPLRVALIAQHTLREAARQKLLLVLVGLALALVVGARWFRDFNFGASELKFLADCGFGAIAFFGAALAIAATAQLFFGEIENRTALTLLAKPVWRAEFILGKFLGVVALAGIFCAVLTSVLALMLWLRERELAQALAAEFPRGAGISYASVALAGLLQWLKLAVLAALTLLVASFAQTQIFAVGAGFFLLVICHLQPLAEDVYTRAGSAVGRGGAMMIVTVFPNFQLFTLADGFVLGGALPVWDAVRLVVYAVVYCAAACGLAVLSFRHREI